VGVVVRVLVPVGVRVIVLDLEKVGVELYVLEYAGVLDGVRVEVGVEVSVGVTESVGVADGRMTNLPKSNLCLKPWETPSPRLWACLISWVTLSPRLWACLISWVTLSPRLWACLPVPPTRALPVTAANWNAGCWRSSCLPDSPGEFSKHNILRLGWPLCNRLETFAHTQGGGDWLEQMMYVMVLGRLSSGCRRHRHFPVAIVPVRGC
jgi:hypothetical protein